MPKISPLCSADGSVVLYRCLRGLKVKG